MAKSTGNRANSRQSSTPQKSADQLLREAAAAMPATDPRYSQLQALAFPVRLPERLYAALPADDPSFAELRAYLAPLVARGSQSPIPRILGVFARDGYAMHMAYSRGGNAPGRPEVPEDSEAFADAQETARKRERVKRAAEGFDFD